MANLDKSDQFSLNIEAEALQSNQSIIDTLLKFCDEHRMEPVDIIPHINRSLKEKLENEFIEARMLPRKSQLNF